MRLAFGFLLILTSVFLPQTLSAMEVCPGKRVFLKRGEEIVLDLGRRKDCNVRSMSLERGTVTRRLDYPSGKTDTRTWSAGQEDNPALYSEPPSRAYFKAETDALVEFLATAPKPRRAEPKVSAPAVRVVEVCGGQTFNIKAGEEFNFRFARVCQTPIKQIDLKGVVEEHVTYQSGKTDRRTLRTGLPWNYPEWPTRITWRATFSTQVTFVPRTPTVAQQPAIPLRKQSVPQLSPQPQVQWPFQTDTSRKSIFDREPSFFSAELLGKVLGFVISAAILIGLAYLIALLSKSSNTFVMSHWYTLIENLQASPKEFQASVERAIETRQIPDIANSRIDWKEGGLFSADREYLRIRREQHVFDICGAPFGTGFFVSWWFGELRPSAIGPTLAAIILINVIYSILTYYFGFLNGVSLTFLVLIAIIFVLGIIVSRNVGKYWVRYVLVIFVVGWLIERLFLPATYYRSDTALMFQEAVRRSVEEVVDGMTKAKGIRALSELEKKPILRELFQRS